MADRMTLPQPNHKTLPFQLKGAYDMQAADSANCVYKRTERLHALEILIHDFKSRFLRFSYICMMFSKLFGKRKGSTQEKPQPSAPTTHSVQVAWDRWSPAGDNDGMQFPKY